ISRWPRAAPRERQASQGHRPGPRRPAAPVGRQRASVARLGLGDRVARVARALGQGRGHDLRRQGHGFDRDRQAVAHGVECEWTSRGTRRGGRAPSGPRGQRAPRARRPSAVLLRASRRGQRHRTLAAGRPPREATARAHHRDACQRVPECLPPTPGRCPRLSPARPPQLRPGARQHRGAGRRAREGPLCLAAGRRALDDERAGHRLGRTGPVPRPPDDHRRVGLCDARRSRLGQGARGSAPHRAGSPWRAAHARVRFDELGLPRASRGRGGRRRRDDVPHDVLGRGRPHAGESLPQEVTPWLRAVCRLFCRAHMADLSLSRSQLLLLAGTANRPLAEEMTEHLGQPLCAVTIRRFADAKIFVTTDLNVRGRDVLIIQPTNPTAENWIELLFLIDAARRASAARTTAVVPYFGYARQDRKDQPRVAISAKLMANLITHAGADRVLGMDFHSHQLQGFFDIPVDHLYAAPVFVSHFRQKQLFDPVVVAPDVGSAKTARGFAKRLNASLAIIDKRRPSANVAEVVNVVGDVENKDCLVPDDMIDTAGTITEAAAALRRLGARKIYAFATHALLSGPAVERLRASPIDEVAVTNTIRIPQERGFEKLKVLSIAGLMAKAIGYEHSNQSVSSLFD